jgi:transposase-like protein
MFKRVPVETKREVLDKIKSGMTVTQAAATYAISTKTIYTWLASQTKPAVSILEVNRLRRENEELKRIIGIITLDLERGKKNRHH